MIVVGAGISGLACAWRAHRRGDDVCVVEAGDAVGGAMRSERRDGYLLEWGPHSLVTTGSEAFDLAESVGVSDRLVSAEASAERRYLFDGERLVAMPRGPLALSRTSLLSWRAKVALLGEPWRAAREIPHETVTSFFSRRLSREWVDRFVDPFVSGIYAGRPERLEVESAFPRLVGWERRYGSLARGALAERPRGRERRRRGGPRSFGDGMQELPRAIASSLPDGSVRTGVRVERIERDRTGWALSVMTPDGPERWSTDRLVLSVPAPAAAKLIRGVDPRLARELDRIPYAPVALVQLGLRTDQLPRRLDGFGFLAPRSSNLGILGAIWASAVFAQRAPEGRDLACLFIGGWTHPEQVRESPARVIDDAVAEFSRALGGRVEPELAVCQRIESAIPQYVPGHSSRRRKIETLIAQAPGLALAGNYLDGVSVHAAIARGYLAADA